MTQFRPPSFQVLPSVIKNLLIINVLVFIAQNTIPKESFDVEGIFALHTFQSTLFKPWQFVTHMFMHGGFDHIFSNMLALWMFGSILENVWGPKRFLTFYIVCGLGASLCHMGVLYYDAQQMISQFNAIDNGGGNYDLKLKLFIEKYMGMSVDGYSISTSDANRLLSLKLNEATLGASGAVFGCLAAFGYLFPNTYIYLYFFIPLKAKWFVILYAGFELVMTIRNSAGDNVAHVAHLGGALVGIILVYYWNKTNKRTFY